MYSVRWGDPNRVDYRTRCPVAKGVRLDGDRLILSNVGTIHVVVHRPVEGTIKTVTLRRARTGKWYASFSCEVERAPVPPSPHVAGKYEVGVIPDHQ